MRSAMWAIGRYETRRLPAKSSKSMQRLRLSTVQATLPWVIITPFGGPVVPEV